jgi:hypothetical protein
MMWLFPPPLPIANCLLQRPFPTAVGISCPFIHNSSIFTTISYRFNAENENIPTAEFEMISAESTCWDMERK